MYDMYGSESESAYAPHGNMEASWSPSEGWTITYDGLVNFLIFKLKSDFFDWEYAISHVR